VEVTEESCLHYWVIEAPKGLWSLATCRKCKKIDAFKNSMDDNTAWNMSNPRKKKEIKKKLEEVQDIDALTKEEFLKQRNPKSIISNGAKYKTDFKLRMVREVGIHGRTEVRKKYGLPETTLRSWVKLYS